MGKRGGKKLGNSLSGSHNSVPVKSMLRHDHLKNLAVFFTGRDTPIPSMAAFFGRSLAADGEAAGIAPDPELFSCLRCETILQPGFNCTVRIEKATAKKLARHNNSNPVSTMQNNVVYTCHFCSHRNPKRGTLKGHMKELCPPKPKTPPPRKKTKRDMPRDSGVHEVNDAGNQPGNMPSSPERRGKDHMDPTDAYAPRGFFNLERSRRKRKPKSGKPADEPETASAMAGTGKTGGGSSKRKRRTWTSLKEIAEQEKSYRALNLKIPFRL